MKSYLILAIGLWTCVTGHYIVLGHVHHRITVTYIGQQIFPIGSNATLACMFEPIPNNIEEINVFWFKRFANATIKLAVSSTVPNASYVYQNAPQDIRDRFFTSQQGFVQGIATASLKNVNIFDSTTYYCEVENKALKISQMQRFNIDIYQRPSVYVEDADVDLDARPFAANDKVTVAVCHVKNAYPAPSKIVFTDSQTKDSWTIKYSDFVNLHKTINGSFGASARLRIEATSTLDGSTISCSAFITLGNMEVTSENQSSPLSVKYITSNAEINISPSSIVQENTEVTISCRADGNPAPLIQIMLPSSEIVDEPYTFLATRGDAGIYRCYAVNDYTFEQATSFRNLQVLWIEPPSIVGPSVVTEGATVELDCSSQSNAGVSYAWTKNGRIIASKKVLTLSSVIKSDSGLYTCTASGVYNTSAQHILRVNIKNHCTPNITANASSSKTQANTAYVRLVCTADGNPGCSMSISPLLEIAQKVREVNRIKVVIPEVEKQISVLRFTCTASNAFSTNSANVTLNLNAFSTTTASNKELACCANPTGGGISAGTTVIIIVLVALVVTGIPLGYYLFRRGKCTKSYDEFLLREQSSLIK